MPVTPAPAGNAPKKKPAGRTLAEFRPLLPAEETLLADCAAGRQLPDKPTTPRPDKKRPDNTIRAGFLRFLLLGGDDDAPVHEHGVSLLGAWIDGDLDLEDCNAPFAMLLRNCVVDGKLKLRDSALPLLALPGTMVDEIEGDRMHCKSSLFLSDGFESSGPVGLVAARIDGDLEAGGAILREKPSALAIPSRPDTRQKAVLSLDRATIGGALYLDDADVDGTISLAGCSAAALGDTAATWEKAAKTGKTPTAVALDGFTYGRLAGDNTPKTADERIPILKRQSEFSPQPWEQLAKVFRSMGLPDEAVKVAIAKQEELGKSYTDVKRLLHKLWGWTYGYGHRPLRLGAFAILAWLAFAGFFFLAAANGAMQPTDGKTLADVAFKSCRVENGGNWTACAALGSGYPAFQPLVYSLDLIVPLVDLNQAKTWTATAQQPCGAPDATAAAVSPGKPNICRAPLGVAAAVAIPIETLLGWLVGLMFGAVAGGFIKRD